MREDHSVCVHSRSLAKSKCISSGSRIPAGKPPQTSLWHLSCIQRSHNDIFGQGTWAGGARRKLSPHPFPPDVLPTHTPSLSCQQEDPLLTSRYATRFVQGMQEHNGSDYMTTVPVCKHFKAYLLRQIFLLILSPFRSTDIFDGAGMTSRVARRLAIQRTWTAFTLMSTSARGTWLSTTASP